MPYIVTVTRPAGLPHGEHPHDYGYPVEVLSRRAVATLEEARGLVKTRVVDSAFTQGSTRGYPSYDQIAAPISESGGTVGSLPDGTTIQVEPAAWHDLARESDDATLLASALQLGDRIEHWPGVQASILEAWNARHA